MAVMQPFCYHAPGPGRSLQLTHRKGTSSSSGINSSIGNNNGKIHVTTKKTDHWKKTDFYYPAMIPEPDYSDSEEENGERRRHHRSVRASNLANTSPSGGVSPQHNNKPNNCFLRSSSNPGAFIMTTTGPNAAPVPPGALLMGTTNSDEEGGGGALVAPKKLANPCLDSQERQNLHKEMLFNKKIGKSVLGQKSELQKAMEKFRDEQKKKELEGEKISKRSSFEKRLEEQASKIKNCEEEPKKPDEAPSVDQSEFLRVHARVRAHTFPVDTES